MKRFLNLLLTGLTIFCCFLALVLAWANDDIIYNHQPGKYKALILVLLFLAFIISFGRFLVLSIKDHNEQVEENDDKIVKLGDKYVSVKDVTIVNIDNSNPDEAVVEVSKEKQDL